MAKTTRERHGMRGTPEYRSWSGLRNRCQNPNNEAYGKYGGRGITVCERWELFSNFYADMGPMPSKQHSIERVDNNGNYCPENCIWAIRKTQCRNRRTSRFLEFRGETKTVEEWSEIVNLPSYLIRNRIDRCGWTVEQALTIEKVMYRRGGISGVA